MNRGVVCQNADIATFIGHTISTSVTIIQAVQAVSIFDEYFTAFLFKHPPKLSAELYRVVKSADKASTHLDSVGERKEKGKIQTSTMSG